MHDLLLLLLLQLGGALGRVLPPLRDQHRPKHPAHPIVSYSHLNIHINVPLKDVNKELSKI